MDQMIAFVIVISLVVIGVGLVIMMGQPIIGELTADVQFKDANIFLVKMDSYIRDVVHEGQGASRVIKSSDGEFRINSNENVIDFVQKSDVYDYLSRKFLDGVLLIAGNDAQCYEQDINNDGKPELVMENSYLLVALQKVDGNYDTAENIALMKEKSLNTTISPRDSSINIDSDTTTSKGTGYSEVNTGKDVARCRAHFFMDSTMSYDIYYTLYSGADFLSIEVRNIE